MPGGAVFVVNSLIKNFTFGFYGTGFKYYNCTIENGLDFSDYSPNETEIGECYYSDCEFILNSAEGYGPPKTLFGKMHNCLFSGTIKEPGFNKDAFHPSMKLESINHNRIQGNYKAWTKGGTIETRFYEGTASPGRLIFNCESEDYPVFRDFPVSLTPQRWAWWWARTRKDFTGGEVKIEVIDAQNDPMIISSASPLASYSLPDKADKDLALKLAYKPDRNIKGILRISAKNSTGTVKVDSRLIEKRIKYGR